MAVTQESVKIANIVVMHFHFHFIQPLIFSSQDGGERVDLSSPLLLHELLKLWQSLLFNFHR
jgi:hypothetical protein